MPDPKNRLTYEDRLDIINQIKSKGFDPTKQDLSAMVASAEALYNNIQDDKEKMFSSENPDESFNVEDSYLSMLKGRPLGEQQRTIIENTPYDRANESQAVTFVEQYNKSSSSPYKMRVVNSPNGVITGFTRNVTNYEKAPYRDANGDIRYQYHRYYNDGTFEPIDENVFNKEKAYNYLPKKLRNYEVFVGENATANTSGSYTMVR